MAIGAQELMRSAQPLLSAQRGIIVAADVTSLEELRSLATLCGQFPEVAAIKAGFSLALRFGLPAVVKAIDEECSLPVIYDHQKAGTDIPAMGAPFAETCREAGVSGIIFFPMAGPKTLESFVSGAFHFGLTPIVGLVMTHPAYLASEGGFIVDNAAQTICAASLNAGARHFVLPGNRPDVTQRFCEGPLAIACPLTVMMPGIGEQGGAIASAFKAADSHYPFAIIGTAIYKAADPKAALKRFAAEVRL